MRENISRQTVTTTNFVSYTGRTEAASSTWTAEQAAGSAELLETYKESFLSDDLDGDGYQVRTEVFEYEQPGLRVIALMEDGAILTVFTVEDTDIARYHTAARTGRVLRVRYAKPSQIVQGPAEVTRRDVEVQRVWVSKAGHVMVTAYDRRRDDTRSFRADRITHTTLHRQTTPVRPSKAALAAAFQAQAPSVSVTIPAPRTAVEESAAWYLYSTQPGTAAALEAPEAVQDELAEAFALGRRYAKVYA
jgi:WYL domain